MRVGYLIHGENIKKAVKKSNNKHNEDKKLKWTQDEKDASNNKTLEEISISKR